MEDYDTQMLIVLPLNECLRGNRRNSAYASMQINDEIYVILGKLICIPILCNHKIRERKVKTLTRSYSDLFNFW